MLHTDEQIRYIVELKNTLRYTWEEIANKFQDNFNLCITQIQHHKNAEPVK